MLKFKLKGTSLLEEVFKVQTLLVDKFEYDLLLSEDLYEVWVDEIKLRPTEQGRIARETGVVSRMWGSDVIKSTKLVRNQFAFQKKNKVSWIKRLIFG